MKKLLFAFGAMILSAGAFAQTKADDIAKFKVETIDQGKVQQDMPAKATFIVTNISDKDLLIESASPTCGCTIGDYTKTPIKPGQTGIITAEYNAKALGSYTKHMNVKFAGADDMKSITLMGEVLTTEEYAKLKPAAASPVASAPVKPAAKTASKKHVAKRTTKTPVKAS